MNEKQQQDSEVKIAAALTVLVVLASLGVLAWAVLG